MKLSSSYFSKKYRFIKVNLFKLFLLPNQKLLTLPPLLPNSYISQASRTIQPNLHSLLSLLASFLKVFWQPFWVYYGQFAEVKNWHSFIVFSKWQFVYLEYLCDIVWSRNYFQICLFSSFKYLKTVWAYRALSPSPESYQEL